MGTGKIPIFLSHLSEGVIARVSLDKPDMENAFD